MGSGTVRSASCGPVSGKPDPRAITIFGFTTREAEQAVCIAAIPDEEFDALVEREEPATLEEQVADELNEEILAIHIRRKMPVLPDRNKSDDASLTPLGGDIVRALSAWKSLCAKTTATDPVFVDDDGEPIDLDEATEIYRSVVRALRSAKSDASERRSDFDTMPMVTPSASTTGTPLMFSSTSREISASSETSGATVMTALVMMLETFMAATLRNIRRRRCTGGTTK